MKKHEQKPLNLNKGLILIQTLQTYRTISRETLNKLNELENLFNKLISASDNPTSCIVNKSNLHLKIAMRTYEMTISLRKDPEFIKSYPNESCLIYTTLQNMSTAHLTQTDKILESDNNLLTYANILNKAAYYYLTKEDQNKAKIFLEKAGCLISNIKNTKSEEYRAITAKTTAALILLTPGHGVITDEILVKLEDNELRILAKSYFHNITHPETNSRDILYNALMCIILSQNIKQSTNQNKKFIRESMDLIADTLIKQMCKTNINQFMKNCKKLAETKPEILIKYLNYADDQLNNDMSHKPIIIKLLKSYCFMRLNDSTNAVQSFAYVNRKTIKKNFPLTTCPEFYSIFLSISNEVEKFISAESNHTQATKVKEENSPPPPKKKKNRKRTKNRKNKSNLKGSNPNRFFQPLSESHTVEENSEDILATQTENKNTFATETTDSFFHTSNESYSDEDIIKLLKDHIKTNKVKIESVIPFNELTDKLTNELSNIKDEKCSALILPINCGLHHAFLYVKQTPNKNPEFFYFDLQENIPENIYDEISKLFPNSKIENVTTPNLEATKRIPKKYDSFLKTIKNPKKYDSLLLYFIECYIDQHGELLFQTHKEDLSAFANLGYNANQEYLSKNSDNTPSMNNTP